ncbi:LuxR C-terminal-related transcriptional regulator [Streptomyces sp. NPDC086080]|uniref:helix-turn-helix transcriptional regulator n=1 Tax=Streptomyces sp. NPDC086080 TaxID=3365748 RepID=UPI0037D215A4
MSLSPVDEAPVDDVVRQVGAVCGKEATVRSAACRPDEARTEHAVLRRLLGGAAPEPVPPHQVHHAALAYVSGLLGQAPLVLSLTDAQWCDEGTLRWIDHLMRGTSGAPLTVLLSLPESALPAAAGAFHDLVAQDYCAVTDMSGTAPGDTGGPARSGLDGTAHTSHPLRVARAAVLLRSTDADLVGALAGLPAGVARRALDAARDLGLLPTRLPTQGTPAQFAALFAALPAAEAERMRAQAAEILNDAGRPPGQVADLLLGQSGLDRPWMTAILKEAATADRHDRPASAARWLQRLHDNDPADVAVRTSLATLLGDIDPTAAHEHLRGLLADTDDPRVRARVSVPMLLTALMTHRAPDTPGTLGALLNRMRGPGAHPASTAGARPTGAAWALSPDDAPDRTHGGTPLPGGGTREYLARAALALRDALVGVDPRTTAADARQVLAADVPRAAWARVAAAQVLGLADDTTAALEHLDRIAADSERREEVWADCHARSARALLLLETGRTQEAAEAARAAARIARGHGWEQDSHLAPVVLALALVARSDLDGAEQALRRLDGRHLGHSVWAHHHHLMAQALVRRGRGRPGEALRLMERCGSSLAEAHVENPVFTTWWLHSADLLLVLGRTKDAIERAEHGQQQAERWPTARSTGLSLLARGMVATAASEQVDLLTESVHVLAGSSDQHALALAELRLGRALLRRDDRKGARSRLHAARATALRCGLTAVAESAEADLAAAGGRPARVALSAAERPVVELAAGGATNRAIADALFLTVRTVEYHLTNAYRKLGVTGRAGLAEWLAATDPESPPAGGTGESR